MLSRLSANYVYSRGNYASRLMALSGRQYAATSEEQDLVVIGGGPGGYVAAIKAGQLGKKVTCIEKRPTLGGTCLNVGCIPSKALLNASHKYEECLKEFPHFGIDVEKVTLNLGNMMKQKSKAVEGLTAGVKFLFKQNQVRYAEGWGTILSPNEVQVKGSDGKVEKIKTKNILIATGSDVANLPFLKIDEETIVSSTGALSLKEVPKKMVVIGGGVIGLELGSVWRRLGADVTVIEFLDAISGGADEEIAKEFLKVLKKQGIKFQLGTKVTGAQRSGKSWTLTTSPAKGNGKDEKVEADVVLVSIGRVPYTKDLGLENVGIKLDERGRVPVNDEFVTSVKSVRAIGDVIRGPMLAHKAEEEGIAAVEYIFKNHGHVNYGAIPSVVYTWPELAWVGKTEQELKAEGAKYKVGKFPFKANSRARTNNETDGLVKFLSDEKTDRILGVHILGSNAGEIIGECVLAMEYGASSEDVARTCHAHPTLTEAVKEAALGVFDKPIHF